MHELSIALSILDLAAEEAAKQGGVRVVAVHLRLGPLSGVVKDSLAAAFELARAGSPLEETALVIEDVPVAVRCPRCDAERPAAEGWPLSCAVCGTPAAEVVRGREMELVALEIES